MALSEENVPPLSKLLFSQVYFSIIPSPGLKGEEAEEVSEIKGSRFLSLLILESSACKNSSGEWSWPVFPT